ncbi:MAG: metallophosphoesterase [Anaerolineales bacterium]|nr:metallophosphoesterase [Anaerolineales bacterium]
MKILSISDKVVPQLYHPLVKENFSEVDLVLACGDLPYYYQEFIVSMLDVPLLFVRGNHDPLSEVTESGPKDHPHGGTDLHRRTAHIGGYLFAGVEGCIRYRKNGDFQYTQFEMWLHVLALLPRLYFNRLRYGRYLDVLITHAPPWGIHDQSDYPHWGIKAFRWLIRKFQPAYHFHGHIHLYRPDMIAETRFQKTQVINTYGYRITRLDPPII